MSLSRRRWRPASNSRPKSKYVPNPSRVWDKFRIEGRSGVPVFVDGREVGVLPWEGVVGVGRHVAWARRPKLGSAPIAVTAVERQTTLVRLDVADLGRVFTLRVEPPTAAIDIDGAVVGAGVWRGALPRGQHTFTATEPGYRGAVLRTDPENGGSEEPTLTLTLAVNPDDPRWPGRSFFSDARGFIGAFAGPIVAASLHAGAESSCPARCTGNGTPWGGEAGARAGVRWSNGVSLDLAGAFLMVSKSLDRTASSSFGDARQYHVSYSLHDSIATTGGLVLAGVGIDPSIAPRMRAHARLAAGALIAGSADAVSGNARTDGAPAPVIVGDAKKTRVAAAVVIEPAVGLELHTGAVTLGVEIALAGLPGHGPLFTHQPFAPTANQTAHNPGAIGNAPGSNAIADERTFGALLLWAPALTVRRAFWSVITRSRAEGRIGAVPLMTSTVDAPAFPPPRRETLTGP